MDKKQIRVGNRFYDYTKDENDNTVLKRKEMLEDKEIEIEIRSGNEVSREEINTYITDLLGNLYIERRLKSK